MSTNEEKIKIAYEMLINLIKEEGIPRHVREACKEVIGYLTDEKITSYAIKAANSVGKLDEVSQDPTLPTYVRTILWKIISVLEQVKD